MNTYCPICHRRGCEDGNYKHCEYCEAENNLEVLKEDLQALDAYMSAPVPHDIKFKEQQVIRRNQIVEEIKNLSQWISE
jgi:hypothetical protein